MTGADDGSTTASSAVVRAGVWQACTSANFQGQCIQLQPGEYRNVNALLNDDVASVREITITSAVLAPVIVAADPVVPIVIESGTWTFCTDAGFRGDCRTLGPGQYA